MSAIPITSHNVGFIFDIKCHVIYQSIYIFKSNIYIPYYIPYYRPIMFGLPWVVSCSVMFPIKIYQNGIYYWVPIPHFFVRYQTHIIHRMRMPSAYIWLNCNNIHKYNYIPYSHIISHHILMMVMWCLNHLKNKIIVKPASPPPSLFFHCVDKTP